MKLLKPLVLASRSPRRLALLRQIGLDPRVIACDIDETFDNKLSHTENALTLAVRKTLLVAGQVQDSFVVGADTIVAVDGMLLGKPADRDDAVRMLGLLSGRSHVVHTAFAIVDRPSGAMVKDVESTRVTFRAIPKNEIEEYVESGSPMDKAGAYGIQDDYGAVFVTRIEGCYYTVVGFPLAKFYTSLQNLQQQLR